MDNTISAWRDYKRLYSLCGHECVSCKKLYYPKSYLCSCGSRNFKDVKFSGNGKLITYTQINYPPSLFKEMTPYLIGIIELDEGVRVVAQITDTSLEELHFGIPVKAVFRKLFDRGDSGIIQYGVKFVPKKFVPKI